MGAEQPSDGSSRGAGWRRADLDWERLQEQGNALLAAGDVAGAARCFKRAGWISFWRFRRADPRHATTQANLACTDRLQGRQAQAQQRYARARRIWAGVDGFIAKMVIARRARSSLFHLRMEAKHLETFHANMRIRMTGFARESAAALEALEAGEPVRVRLVGRWRAEKMPIFDDTRKFLAAALLIAVPGAGAPAPRG